MTNYVVPVTGDKYCRILAKTNMGYPSFVSYFKKCSPLQKQESCDDHADKLSGKDRPRTGGHNLARKC